MPNLTERWSVHYLNARGALDPFQSKIDSALSAVARRAAAVCDLPALDIAVQPVAGRVIPELGFVGYVPGPGVMTMTIDPDNPNLPDHLDQTLERMIAHELHHVLRFESVGYGSTLFEALVSEGLAGHFSKELYGNTAEPWERAVSRPDLPPYATKALEWADRSDYDHAAWFFGSAALPRWVGYTIGYEVISDFLSENRSSKPSKLADTEASQFMLQLKALSIT